MSSWIRSAMNKAAEVPGSAMFRAVVRTYTDTIVNHAGNSVSEAAKMFQDHITNRNIQSFSDVARRLEEVSVSCKGEERVQCLRKWFVALREYEKLDESQLENDRKSFEDPQTVIDKNVTHGKPIMILYYDPDLGNVPMNFRDVFLQSQALEGMTMSMILGEPNEEEIFLLHNIFGLCLTGGREIHDAIVKNIQDLAKAFSVYDGEMLVRKEELLQFAKTAISGLKVTADVSRIDSEISQIQQSLNRMNCQKSVDEIGNSSEATINASPRDAKEFVAHIQLCCRLKSLISKKRLLKKGDTPETHAQKKQEMETIFAKVALVELILHVDKLKVLLESLYNSAYKTEKRILEHREQKKEILNFRVARTIEVSQIEKDLEAEVSLIEKQRNELEAELRKVNSTLAAANARLQDAREQRLQFDEDNNEFLIYLKEKEDELSKTIYSYRAEADRCDAFINFLETTWDFQSSFEKQRDKQVNDQLQNHEAYFINAATSFLSTFKDQLEPAIANLRKILEGLNGYQYIIDPAEEFLQDIKQRESFEQEYLDAEAKVINIFHAVQSIKELFYSMIDDASRKGVEVVNELCSAIENIKRDFKTIKRPILRIEISTNEEEFSPATGSPQGVMILSPGRVIPDFKSIFGQKLIKSPRKSQKPYIPLGGSPENSPLSSKGNDTIFSENKHQKSKVWESERPSHIDKDVSSLTLNMENKTLEEMSPGQEKNLYERSTLDLDKELVKLALQKETGMNTMATEGGHEKLFETSTEKCSRYDTTDDVNGKEFRLSTSKDKKSVDPDVELSKSTSGIKADEFSTEEVVGLEFNKPVNEHKYEGNDNEKTLKLSRLKTF